MSESWKPDSAEQVADAVAWAAAEELPLSLSGRGSKGGIGRPVQAAHSLSLAGLTGITLYEPEELVLSARAGTPLAEIEATIAEQGQILAFEPPDLGPLLGRKQSDGSLGGMIGCNLAGPRRIKAGAARDHFLGFRGVSGRGEAFKSGGRVVKNVTGYDLCKLMAGSYGTLAALTDITIKILPGPEKTWTVLLLGLDDRTAVTAMTRALNSSHEVSGAAHLPAPLAAASQVSYVAKAGGNVTALRLEGPGPSVEHRTAALRQELADLGASEELHSHNSANIWQDIRDVRPFWDYPDHLVWRLSVPPQSAPAVIGALTPGETTQYFYDWGGGLIWLAMPADDDPQDRAIRRAVSDSGGHATLIRAPESQRAAIPVFEPQEPAKALLSQRIKAAFDPHGVLNPGRMTAGT